MYEKEVGDQGSGAENQSESIPVHFTAASGSNTPNYPICCQSSSMSYSPSNPTIPHTNEWTGPCDVETKVSPSLGQCKILVQSPIDDVDGLAREGFPPYLPWPARPESTAFPSPFPQLEHQRRQGLLRLCFIPEESMRSATQGLPNRNDGAFGLDQQLPSPSISGGNQEHHCDGHKHNEKKLTSIPIKGAETLSSTMTSDNAKSGTYIWETTNIQDEIGRHDLPPRSWRKEPCDAQTISSDERSKCRNNCSSPPFNQGASFNDAQRLSNHPWEYNRYAPLGDESPAHAPRKERNLEHETQPLSSKSAADSTFDGLHTTVGTSQTASHEAVLRQSSVSPSEFPLDEKIPGYQITFQRSGEGSQRPARRKWPHRSSWPCYRRNWAPKIDFTDSGSDPMDSDDMMEYRGTKRQRLNPGCEIWQNESNDNRDDVGGCKVDLDTADLDPWADPHWQTEWV